MTLRKALQHYLSAKGIRPKGAAKGELYGRWLCFSLGWFRIPVLPLVGSLKQTILLHDAHHLITGYKTDIPGEMQLAAWELGSGGCGGRWLALNAQLKLPFWGLLCPLACIRAFKRGRRGHNLYVLDDPSTVLDMEFEEAKRVVTRSDRVLIC